MIGGVASCAVGEFPVSEDAGTTEDASDGGSEVDAGPCGIDCSKLETSQCTIAVCNTGQVIGPLNTCVVVPAPKGTPCDDGKFCTIDDVCDDNATCGGGKQNQCGIIPEPCSSVICYEESKSCDVAPVNDGTSCTPKDLCQTNGVCQIGECIGEPKDCTFSPLNECNKVSCDPATGKCIGTPDANKDNNPCVLTGDLCHVNRACSAGQCVGGAPKDCTAFNVGCQIGVCDDTTGVCGPAPAPVGTSCNEGVSECQVGACDVKGQCLPSSAPDGTACNDYNACTEAEVCMAGECVNGKALSSCTHYLLNGFEACPDGWTFAGDWQCGIPDNVGPTTAHIGSGVIATQIAGVYHVNQGFSNSIADSPIIDLTSATNPMLSFWAWDHTEGGTFDGWNLKISTDGGQTFNTVTSVSPPYNLSLLGQPAWGGDHSADGWQNHAADLSAYVGQSVILRFAFRSDGATVFPGVYVDDFVVAEPLQIPLYVTTTSPLPDVYAGMAYSTELMRVGGTANAVWSLKPGGQNNGWLTIDPTTGVLSGTPSSADVGTVMFTVHVEEPTLPSNFAEKTFTFAVKHDAYYTSFEGTCPDGWTLTGDWECGTPSMVGPTEAYQGTQCIATKIGGLYANLQTYGATTATSPDIDLSASANPLMTFRMWIDTEGSTYDGVNVKVSNDGGMTYSVLNSVLPVYPLTVAGQPAWGGHQSGLGWQLMQADLSAYAGQIIRVRFSFQTDSSGIFPGVYIDDIFVD